ncbi:MAG: hypothetical protein PHY30_02345 [Candidatus Pacebacteria bacterium]|nr:hypothetical protein [Candidatus Paceibacterota bacterium]
MDKEKILIFSLSGILFLAASFIVYSWSEPTTMPSSYDPPINTSITSQTKKGQLKTEGALYAPMIYDQNNINYYIDPSLESSVEGFIENKLAGSLEVGKKLFMLKSTTFDDSENTVATKGYVDQEVIVHKNSLVCANKVHDGGGCVSCDPGYTMLWVEENGHYNSANPCNISYFGDDIVCSRCSHSTNRMTLRCCTIE